MSHTCSRCPATWTALTAAHCPSCHRTFSRVSGFDRHRRDGACINPTTVGLIHNPARDLWTSPPPDPTVNPWPWTGPRALPHETQSPEHGPAHTPSTTGPANTAQAI